MITFYEKKAIFAIAKTTIWNKKDRKDFRWLWYLGTVATNHTLTEPEKIRLRQLKRKYAPPIKKNNYIKVADR